MTPAGDETTANGLAPGMVAGCSLAAADAAACVAAALLAAAARNETATVCHDE